MVQSGKGMLMKRVEKDAERLFWLGIIASFNFLLYPLKQFIKKL